MDITFLKKIIIVGAAVLIASMSCLPCITAVHFTIRQYEITESSTLKIITVPDDYPTIQQAVNHATMGDTVFVRNGTYNENIVINTMIRLLGEEASMTYIDGSQKDTVVKTTSDGVTIANFTIQHSGSDYAGIHLASHYNTVTNNVITENYYGMQLFPSTGNQITNNYIYNNDADGLWLRHSHENTIENNFILENGNDGILANYSSLSNHITHNYISENKGNGISLSETSFGSISTSNSVTLNDIGLNTIGGSDNNLYYDNKIEKNTQNAFDTSANLYDNDQIGNYWGDYQGVDENGDGVGDIPYTVPGGSNTDRWPRVEPPSDTNFAPLKPSRPWGPMKGKVGSVHTFYATITDPEGDDVYCEFSWGDGTTGTAVGPMPSGETHTCGHMWVLEGDYAVRVRGRDIYGQYSPWSEPVIFICPKNKDDFNYSPIVSLLYRILPFYKTVNCDIHQGNILSLFL